MSADKDGKSAFIGFLMVALRFFVGGMFVYLGYKKIFDQRPEEFLKVLDQFEIFSPEQSYITNVLAVTLPFVEVLLGACLIFGVMLRGASLTVLVQMIAFTAAVALRAKGIYDEGGIEFCAIEFDCGCGTGEVKICEKLVENGSLLVGSLLLFLINAKHFALYPVLGKSRKPEPTPLIRP